MILMGAVRAGRRKIRGYCGAGLGMALLCLLLVSPVGADLRGTPMLQHSSAEPEAGEFVQGGDPFAWVDPDGSGYLYTTNRPGQKVPVYRSDDLQHWTALGDAMPALPPWAKPGKTWAPEVIRLLDGRYALFYTAANRHNGKQCIGRAIATHPAGPFEDAAAEPFICHPETATSIDPSPFRDDDGSLYLLWKTRQGEGSQYLSKIWIQRLDQNAMLEAGSQARVLLINDLPWEGRHVEAPTMLRHDGRYLLFYSAGASTETRYAVSFAASDNPLGPFEKHLGLPILKTGSFLKGPGHQSIVPAGPASYMIFYHTVHPERRRYRGEPARYVERSYLCFQQQQPALSERPCGVQR